eukprot:2663543-Rhodomonas_salina.4
MGTGHASPYLPPLPLSLRFLSLPASSLPLLPLSLRVASPRFTQSHPAGRGAGWVVLMRGSGTTRALHGARAAAEGAVRPGSSLR